MLNQIIRTNNSAGMQSVPAKVWQWTGLTLSYPYLNQ